MGKGDGKHMLECQRISAEMECLRHTESSCRILNKYRIINSFTMVLRTETLPNRFTSANVTVMSAAPLTGGVVGIALARVYL